MLKAVLNAKVIDSKTGKPVKLAKKGTTTRTIQNTEAHLATLQLEAKLNIGKHLSNKYLVGDWKTFEDRYKVVPRSTDKGNSDSASSEANDESSESSENDNKKSDSANSKDPKPGSWA